MKIKLNMLPPAIVLYNGELKVAGRTKLFYVRIDESRYEEASVLAHELRHVLHFWVLSIVCFIPLIILLPETYKGVAGLSFALYSLLYKFVPKFRLWAEIDCFRKNLEHEPEKIETFARYIATGYNVDISEADALEKLKR